MKQNLEQRLRAVRRQLRSVHPDEAWLKRTRKTLVMQVGNSLSDQPVSVFKQTREFFKHFAPWKALTLIRGPVVALLSVLSIVVGGSIASASAAEHALPGDFFYSLKLATEQARLAFAADKEDRLKLKIEFTTRRGQELKEVVQTKHDDTKPTRVVQATEILKRDLKTVKEQLDDVKQDASSSKTVEMAKLVDQKTQELVQTLQETKADIPLETKSNVTEAQVAAADTGARALEVLVEKHEESEDSISEKDVVQAIHDHTKTVADATGGDHSLVATSSVALIVNTTSTVAVPLQQAVDEMRAASVQAFAFQKLEEQKAVDSAASSSAMMASGASGSSTTSGVGFSSSSSQALPPFTSATSTAPDKKVSPP